MAQGHKFQDLEEMGEVLLEYINSSQTDKLQQINSEHQTLFQQHLETKKVLTKILTEEAELEEGAGQQLLDLQQQKQQVEQELESLDQELRQNQDRSRILDSELEILKAELETLRTNEHQLDTLQQEVEEDTTEVIPSAVYVAQLYQLITRIKWEYETPPTILKGVHYGSDLATPINMDVSSLSGCDVSDQLWGFVSSEW